MKFRELLQQMIHVVQLIQKRHRTTFLIATLGVVCFGSALLYFSFKNSYITLYQENSLSIQEKNERRHLLEEMGIPFKESKSGELKVPKEDYDTLKQQFASSSILSKENAKGFELFDSNTWIKGDKELQVLEMRALRGQLERDLMDFESVKGARISFDVAPQKKFSGQPQKAKASVILSLVEGQKLSFSQLHAITAHLAGAVPSLEPHMISVSDTKGRLYQIPDLDSGGDPSRIKRLLHEERLQGEVSSLLDKLLGNGNYHLTLEGDDQKLALSVCYDLSLPFEEKVLHERLVRHLQKLTKNLEIEVSALSFWNPKTERVNTQPLWGFFHLGFFLFILLIPMVLYAIQYLRKPNVIQTLEEEKLTKIVPKINLEKLAKSLESEDPELIAWTLSYLEPKRAEKIINQFPSEFQEEVMHYLSEMEKEEI